jgi:predicted phosphodiesterase
MALKLTMIIPDIHYPVHDPEAVACMLKAAKILQPERVVFLGDALECAQFSRHDRKALDELVSDWDADMDGFIRDILVPLERCSKRRAFVEGNHEYRVEAAALRNHEIRAVWNTISPRIRIGRRKRMEYVPYQTPVLGHYKIAPSLWAIHGWSHGEHAASVHLAQSSNFSIWHGHTHRNQSDSKNDPATGRLIRAMCPGFLGLIQPKWIGSKPTKWSHGFGLSLVDERTDEHWSFTCEIDRGTTVLPLLPNGRRISA